ncbi:MAG: hypothetical protein IPL38_00790 [Rhodobacter sp.]|jgi:hypothetical protein|nr:hypothetical protein [Rhodobacter sp.]MBK8438092.1 hypothetical protein [Rhodobacter sp.]
MKVALCLLATLAMASPALARNLLDTVFPGGSGCYERLYSKSHLAEHPEQMVKRITLGISRSAPTSPDYTVTTVTVVLRGDPEVYANDGYCKNKGDQIVCSMEGDMGGFTLKSAEDGAILLKVAKDGMSFEGNRFVDISGASGDDRSFLMPRAEAGACP